MTYGYPAMRDGKRPICFSPWKLARTLRSLEEGGAVEQVSRESEAGGRTYGCRSWSGRGLFASCLTGLAFYAVDEEALGEAEGAA